MDDYERLVIERAGTWAQAVEDLDAADRDIEQAREGESSRDRMRALHVRQVARADLTQTEIALLDAVRAMWSAGRKTR